MEIIKIPQLGPVSAGLQFYFVNKPHHHVSYLVTPADDALLVAGLVPGVGDPCVLVQDGVVEGVGLCLEDKSGLWTGDVNILISPGMVIGLLREIYSELVTIRNFTRRLTFNLMLKATIRETFIVIYMDWGQAEGTRRLDR